LVCNKVYPISFTINIRLIRKRNWMYMLHCTIVYKNNIESPEIMPFVEAVTHFLLLALLARTLMFFRPLLSGLVRALVLTVRPRLPRPARNAAP
jgi:hypothetical protein